MADVQTRSAEAVRRVLIVDDHRDLAESMADALAPHGYNVECATGSARALELARSFSPDVAFVDVRLGAENGLDLLSRFRSALPGMLCVVMTAYSHDGVATRAVRQGAYDYLRKPVHVEDLLATLARCYEKVELVQAREQAEQDLQERNMELERINARLKQVVESARKLTVCVRLAELAPLLLEEFAQDMAAGGGSLYLRNQNQLVLAHAMNPKAAPERLPYDAESDDLLCRVIEEGCPALVPDVSMEPALRGTEWERLTGGSLLAFPLKDEADAIDGVVCLYNGPDRAPFTPQDLDLGTVLASAGSESMRALQAMEALVESEERMRTVLEESRDIVFRYDMQRRVLEYASPAVESILGMRPDDIVGRGMNDLLELLHPADREQLAADLQPDAPGDLPDIPESVTCRVQHADGSWRWLGINGTVAQAGGRPSALVGTGRDVTDHMAAEAELARILAELARSNSELERFAYVASHDLQEPLRMVTSYVRLLERRYRDKLDDDANDFIGFAVEGVARMSALIHDLLAYSRVSTRGMELEPVEMEQALAEALANLRLALEESGAQVTHDRLPSVMADRAQMVQLLQNLVGNAVKFRGEEAPRVHVSVAEMGVVWEFCVRDNGIGMDPSQLEAVFVVFRRLHSRGEYPGTGIGLAICQRIVERHGGSIRAESAPGGGASFYFTMPIPLAEEK